MMATMREPAGEETRQSVDGVEYRDLTVDPNATPSRAVASDLRD